MGMFDTVHFRCKGCNTPLEFQTKAGECLLSDFSIENAPLRQRIGK